LRQFSLLAVPEMVASLKSASRRLNALKNVEDQLAHSMVLGVAQFISTAQNQFAMARAMMVIGIKQGRVAHKFFDGGQKSTPAGFPAGVFYRPQSRYQTL
jgi:hypothetical protein